MPNRLIREGFLDSEPVNKLTDPAECFFHRLMLAADDAGRMDGRVDILRSRLFPLDLGRRASDVEKQLEETVKEGLVIPYTWDSRPFLQCSKWQRCSPCATSKFPWKDGSHAILYVKRDTRDGLKEFVSSSLLDGIHIPSVTHINGKGGLLKVPPVDGDVYEDGDVVDTLLVNFEEFWKKYPRKVGKDAARKSWKKIKPSKELFTKILKTIDWQKDSSDWIKEDGKFIPHPSTWLNQGRWDDEPVKTDEKGKKYVFV